MTIHKKHAVHYIKKLSLSKLLLVLFYITALVLLYFITWLMSLCFLSKPAKLCKCNLQCSHDLSITLVREKTRSCENVMKNKVNFYLKSKSWNHLQQTKNSKRIRNNRSEMAREAFGMWLVSLKLCAVLVFFCSTWSYSCKLVLQKVTLVSAITFLPAHIINKTHHPLQIPLSKPINSGHNSDV